MPANAVAVTKVNAASQAIGGLILASADTAGKPSLG